MASQVYSEAITLAEGAEIQLGGDRRLGNIMCTLIELTRQGIDPHSATWFYYDYDFSRDADVSHTFFAICGDKVIVESHNFFSDDPLVLKRKVNDDDPIWHSHSSFDEAFERYWYRRFYTETLPGQLMGLRPDEPILYHYERPQALDIARESNFCRS